MSLTAERPAVDWPRSTTRRDLRRYRGLMLLLAVITLGVSVAFSVDAVLTTRDVTDRRIPLVLELRASREAMVAADLAAVRSFGSGRARLGGPGEEYQNQIALAGQSLTQVARSLSEDDGAVRRLQLVEVQLHEYVALISQADTQFQQHGLSGLTSTYLWYASRVLRAPGTGIFDELDELLTEAGTGYTAGLEAVSASPWTTRWPPVRVDAHLARFVPTLLLAVVLVPAQLYLRRKFRRRVNAWLLPATVVTLLLLGSFSWSWWQARHHVEAVRDVMNTATQAADRRFQEDDRLARYALSVVVSENLCPKSPADCGRTFEDFSAAVRPGPAMATTGDRRLALLNSAVSKQAETLTPAMFDLWGVLLVELLLGIAVWRGPRRAINEYRWRR
jgi:hypothetical protein